MHEPQTMRVSGTLRLMKLSAQCIGSGIQTLLVAVIFALLGSGCLRFGYGQHSDAGERTHDAGTRDGGVAGAGAKGGRSGSGKGGAGGANAGAGGKAGMSSNSGSGGNGDAGNNEADTGVVEPMDAGSDAGMTEPTDGGADSGAADSGTVETYEKCPEQPGVLFCDSFEDPNYGRWAYHVENNGTYELSTTHVRTGSTSMHATTGMPAPMTQVRRATEVLANQKSGDAWLRFYNWLPSSVNVMPHFSIGGMSESAMPYDGFELRILAMSVDINSSSGMFPGMPMMKFPRDRWVCVELHVSIDATNGKFEAYLDGVLAATSGQVNTLPADGFTAAEVGVKYASPMQGPVELYVDDVAVARTRIPCD
jgi:hypothetical protein